MQFHEICICNTQPGEDHWKFQENGRGTCRLWERECTHEIFLERWGRGLKIKTLPWMGMDNLLNSRTCIRKFSQLKNSSWFPELSEFGTEDGWDTN